MHSPGCGVVKLVAIITVLYNTSTVHSSDIIVIAGGVLQSRDNNSVSGHIKLRGESDGPVTVP